MADQPSGVARRVAWSAALTAVSLAMFETLAQLGGWLPEPVGLLALIVVSCAFVGGSQGGLASAAICVVFSIVAGLVGSLMFPWDSRHFGRASIAAYTLPALALLVGMLRIQAQNRLSRYNVARAEADTAERRYRELIEGLGGVFWQVRLPDLSVEFVSHRSTDLFGYPVTHWLDSDRIWHELVHPDDRDLVIAALHAASSTGQTQEIDHRVVRSTGDVICVRSLVQSEDDSTRNLVVRGVTVPSAYHLSRATGGTS
jgi:PAS domain-containing protein